MYAGKMLRFVNTHQFLQTGKAYFRFLFCLFAYFDLRTKNLQMNYVHI